MTVALSLVILFLPAIIELKKPKDAGPRLIVDSFEQTHLKLKTDILNIDSETKFNMQSTYKIDDYLNYIQNLEN